MVPSSVSPTPSAESVALVVTAGGMLSSVSPTPSTESLQWEAEVGSKQAAQGTAGTRAHKKKVFITQSWSKEMIVIANYKGGVIQMFLYLEVPKQVVAAGGSAAPSSETARCRGCFTDAPGGFDGCCERRFLGGNSQQQVGSTEQGSHSTAQEKGVRNTVVEQGNGRDHVSTRNIFDCRISRYDDSSARVCLFTLGSSRAGGCYGSGCGIVVSQQRGACSIGRGAGDVKSIEHHAKIGENA